MERTSLPGQIRKKNARERSRQRRNKARYVKHKMKKILDDETIEDYILPSVVDNASYIDQYSIRDTIGEETESEEQCIPKIPRSISLSVDSRTSSIPHSLHADRNLSDASPLQSASHKELYSNQHDAKISSSIIGASSQNIEDLSQADIEDLFPLPFSNKDKAQKSTSSLKSFKSFPIEREDGSSYHRSKSIHTNQTSNLLQGSSRNLEVFNSTFEQAMNARSSSYFRKKRDSSGSRKIYNVSREKEIDRISDNLRNDKAYQLPWSLIGIGFLVFILLFICWFSLSIYGLYALLFSKCNNEVVVRVVREVVYALPDGTQIISDKDVNIQQYLREIKYTQSTEF